MGKNAVQSGHARIIDCCRLMAEMLQTEPGLLSYRQIRRACGDYRHRASANILRNVLLIAGQQAGCFMIAQPADAGADIRCLSRINAGGNDRHFLPKHGSQNFDELADGLVFTEHRFRQTGAQQPLMIETGGVQHLCFQPPQPGQNLLRAGCSAPHLLQE